MLTSYEICQRAADHIETYGWHKGNFLATQGEYVPGTMYPACAVGACKYASGYYAAIDKCYSGDEQNNYAWTAARTAWLTSPESMSMSFTSFHAYNDDPGTTKEDVIRILRNCPKG